MIKKIKINNKDNFTTIIIKNNYISKYLKNLSKKEKKIYCIVDSKVKYIVPIGLLLNFIINHFL